MYELKRNSLRFRKVKTKAKVFGNTTSQWAISMTNLTAIPSGSIGTIVEYDESVELPADFITVRFENGLFANISLSIVEFLEKDKCQVSQDTAQLLESIGTSGTTSNL